MKLKYFLYTVVLFLLSISNSYPVPLSEQAKIGGQVKFQNLSIDEGLSQVTVYCILQDHRGFMWFGTRDGLNRYDGYKFTTYRHKPYDSTTITHNKINALYEDHRGILWIGTDDGLNKYNRDLNIFEPFEATGVNFTDLCHNIINIIYEDQKGVLWIGTENGLCRLNKERNAVSVYRHSVGDDSSISNNQITAIYGDTQGVLWIGTKNGLNYLEPGSNEIIHFNHFSGNSNAIGHNEITAIYQDETGVLWIGTNGGLIKYDPEQNRFKTYKHHPYNNKSISNNSVNAIWQDKNSCLWVGTDNGLSILEIASEEFTNFYSEQPKPFSLSDNNIYSIYEDRSGIVWIGTYGGGICKYDPQMERFAHYLIQHTKTNHIRDNFIYAFEQNATGVLWIGTNHGLYRFDRKTGQYKLYSSLNKNQNGLTDNRVRKLFFDSRGYLWIGTYDGLNRLDIKNETFRVYKHEPGNKNSLSDNFVISMNEYPSGVLWIGTFKGGLNKFEIDKHKFTHFSADTSLDSPLSSDNIFAIHADKKGYLWLGTYGGGLNRLNIQTGKVKAYKYDPNNLNSINGNFIYTIHEDDNGILWIGMFGGGLNRFDPRTEKFTRFDNINDLQNSLIYGILEDNKNRLWMSTNHGLMRFNPEADNDSGRFRQYDKMDGLQSTEFNFGAYFKNSAGEMFFGGVNGFNVFQPDSISEDIYKPPVILTNIQINHKDVEVGTGARLNRAISELQKIELYADDNTVTFEFSSLDYSNPQKNQYAYRLAGVDNDWIYVSASKRFAQYTNLPGGNYVLMVRGSNSDGVWNDKGISLRVIVHPVFWDTLWFKILIGLLLIGVGFIVYNIRTNNIRRRNAQLREMNFALSKEIEERLRVEEALQVSEEKYRTITDNLHAGIYRNTAKSRGKFIEVNPTFVDMFGFNSKEEALDANATQLYMNVKDRNRFKRKIRKNGLVENEEFRLKRKDGSTFWASITAVAVYNDKGELRYYDGMIEDINERKRVEDALIESEEKYRILVERATDGILIIKKGKVAYANPRMSMISGYSGEELLGASLTSFLEDEEIEKLDEYDKNRKNKKEAASTYEIILHHKEGRKVVTEVNISPITYEGEPADLVFLRDISVRRHFEIQLRQTHKMEAIGHLAGGVAHDFNNILTVINGHAELAQLMMTKRHRAYKHIDDVIRSAEKASNLIRQLLAFSRQQIIEPKIVDVNNIITSLDKMLHRIIGEDLQIISNLAQDLPSIKADPGQIEQVLMNLIINARDAILENPNQKAEKLIVIETSEAHISESYAKENLDTKAGDYILISIKDNGKGMDQATIDRIFDPFFTTKEQGKGTGLGLATVFGIVKQNEGHILVDSKPGKGTIIKVYWPYAELEEMPDEDETLSELKIGGSETILLVEDEENVLEFTKEALESSGYQVLEASNGLEALNILKQNSRKIDLIISDVVMPKMTGQELAEKVKKNYPDLKVILMSGYTDSQIIRSGTERQSVNFIYKPFSIKTISKKVRDVLDR